MSFPDETPIKAFNKRVVYFVVTWRNTVRLRPHARGGSVPGRQKNPACLGMMIGHYKELMMNQSV